MLDGLTTTRRATAVVPTHDSRRWVDACLPSLLDGQHGDLEVVVVDNASSDGTPEHVTRAFPAVHVVALERNAGYAGALCEGARRAGPGRDILALNVDTVVAPGAVPRLLRALDADPRCGVVAPRLHNADGTLQPSIYPLPTVGGFIRQTFGLTRVGKADTDHERRREVEWASGAALLVRRGTWDAVGGFDPGYRFYVEEIDFQRRVRDAGWSVVFEPAAVITHHGGFAPVPVGRFLLSHDGFERYFGVHEGRPAQVAVRLALCLLAGSRWAAWTGIAAVSPRRRPTATAWAAMFGPVTVRSLLRVPGALVRRHEPPAARR